MSPLCSTRNTTCSNTAVCLVRIEEQISVCSGSLVNTSSNFLLICNCPIPALSSATTRKLQSSSNENEDLSAASTPNFPDENEVETTTIHTQSFLRSTVTLLINPDDLNWDVSRASHWLWIFVMGMSVGVMYLILLALEQDRYLELYYISLLWNS